MLSKYEGSQSMKLNVTGLVESQDQDPTLRDKEGLGLFMGLRAMREHAITHRNVFSLSSLKEKGTLDISKVRVFL